VLERIERLDKPQILDLGPFCGDTAVYLADKGARVSVEEFEPPRAASPDDPEGAPPYPVRLEQDDDRFDLVLAWERVDFTPPERLRELGSEIHRVLAEGGYLLLMAQNKPGARGPQPDLPRRFRLVADDQLMQSTVEGSPQLRWTHPTREIERALAPLSIQGIHLQRDQTREFLALKKKRSK
jgi:hypothetical protein